MFAIFTERHYASTLRLAPRYGSKAPPVFLSLALDIRALLYVQQACIKGDVSSMELPRARFYLGFRKTAPMSEDTLHRIAFRGYFRQQRDSSQFGRDRSRSDPDSDTSMIFKIAPFPVICWNFLTYLTYRLVRCLISLNRNDILFNETLNFKSKNVIKRYLIEFIRRRVRFVQVTWTKLLLPSSARFVGNESNARTHT